MEDQKYVSKDEFIAHMGYINESYKEIKQKLSKIDTIDNQMAEFNTKLSNILEFVIRPMQDKLSDASNTSIEYKITRRAVGWAVGLIISGTFTLTMGALKIVHNLHLF